MPPAAAAVVAPVVDAWQGAGLRCFFAGIGMPDKVPYWECQGQLLSADVSVELWADDAGIHDWEAFVPATTPTQVAVAAFQRLLDLAPAFAERKSAISAWLGEWEPSKGDVVIEFPGQGASIGVGGSRIVFSVGRGGGDRAATPPATPARS